MVEKQKHSTFETGYGKLVANLDKLISVLISFGIKFSPSNSLILILSLQDLYTVCKNKILQLIDDITPYVLAVDDRNDAYDFMDSYSTRAMRILKSSSVTDRQIEDANSLLKLLRGKRKVTIAEAASETAPVLTPEEIGEAGNETATKLKRSVSQLSFDSRVEHFRTFVKLLSAIPKYNPNEDDLKIPFFNNYISTLDTLNHNVNSTGSQVQKTRRERNILLYDEKIGLVECARLAKDYVGGAFGFRSPEHKQVLSIEFKSRKL